MIGKIFGLLFAVLLLGGNLSASVLPLPQASFHDLLSESVPTAFPPDDFDEEEFSLVWDGDPLEGVSFHLQKGSIQWARVNEVLALPRARLEIEVQGFESGIVNYHDFTIPLGRIQGEERLHASLVVALVSGGKNPIELRLGRSGRELRGRLLLQFRSKRMGASRVYRDPSCSKYSLEIESEDKRILTDDQWIYVGCRVTVAGAHETRAPSLEIYVFWDHVGSSIEVGGMDTETSAISTWAMKVGPEPGFIHVASKKNRLKFTYLLPKQFHFGSLSLGIGPYGNYFDALGTSVSDTRPLVTLYGSYFISEGVRFVGFNATSLGAQGYNDLGFYLHNENFKVLDRRLSLNLLLGGHVIGFSAGGSSYFLFGIPQGIEMIYTDFLVRGKNLSMGGFVYPKIDGKSYHNLWLRWGFRTFVEINFILWEEMIHGQSIFSRNLGVSLGFPLAQFL